MDRIDRNACGLELRHTQNRFNFFGAEDNASGGDFAEKLYLRKPERIFGIAAVSELVPADADGADAGAPER